MTTPLDRRTLFGAAASLLALAACSRAEAQTFPVQMSDAEWRRKLGPESYRVLRQEGTERPFSSPLDREKRRGIFACRGCGNPAYASNAKFDSGTGWPSFWAPTSETRIGTKTDFNIGLPRTEVHCARCGGHFGHIFNDGPPPTGKRHCLNGLALRFVPAT